MKIFGVTGRSGSGKTTNFRAPGGGFAVVFEVLGGA
jgi:dephospho-CoA kinase